MYTMPELTPALALHEMAAPLQEPNALPDGIDLAVGIIASNPSMDVKVAATDVIVNFYEQDLKALGDLSNIHQGAYEAQLNAAEQMRKLRIGFHSQSAKKIQDFLGRTGNLDIAPDSHSMKRLFEHQDAAQEYQDKDPFQDPKVVAAREELAIMMTEQMLAEIRREELKEDLGLAHQVNLQRNRLAKRGRMGTVLATTLLSGMASFGLYNSIDETPPQPTTVHQSYEQQKQAIAKSAENKSKKILAGAIPFIGALAGVGLGSARSDRFARRRAQKLIKKAETSQA